MREEEEHSQNQISREHALILPRRHNKIKCTDPLKEADSIQKCRNQTVFHILILWD